MNSKLSREQIIEKAFKFHSEGNIAEALKYYQNFIKQGFKDHRISSNYALILQNTGKLKEAEILYRQAIEINPDFANAHYNLGNLLKDFGKLEEAELYTRKAIELNPDFAEAYTNLGIISSSLRQFQKAELFYLKAIEIKPNLAQAHTNLGNLLKDLGKLKEAEIYTRKAIQINPKNEIAHSNLGNILMELGQLKEAEIITRKAIELNPDFAEAYLNIGSILIELGQLKEAEIFTRKAIKLNPDFAEAHSNLGNILRDLGKLEELIILSKSTLESKKINKGYKLLALIRLIKANLLSKKFSEVIFNINKTNDFINQGALNFIDGKQNRMYALTYSGFFNSLYPLLEKENINTNSLRIPHYGESHCLSFANQNISSSSQKIKIQPVLITGGKAWHFAMNKKNRWKDSLIQQMKHHKYSKKVFISFGEIDCRKDEGILKYATNNNKKISEVCEKTITGYLNYLEEMLSIQYSKRYKI